MWKHESNWSCSFGFLFCVVGMCSDGSEVCTSSICRVTKCGSCVGCEVQCWDWCSCEPHYSQQSHSLLTLIGAFTISLLTSPSAHFYLLILTWRFTSCLPTSGTLPLPTVHFQLCVHGLSTHMCSLPHSLLLMVKRAVIEMLSVGSILTLYFSPSSNC
jgi:hypothetical protein